MNKTMFRLLSSDGCTKAPKNRINYSVPPVKNSDYSRYTTQRVLRLN